VSNFIENAANPVRQFEDDPVSRAPNKRKSPLPNIRRGLHDFRDDVSMQVICPTCQVPRSDSAALDNASPDNPPRRIARNEQSLCRLARRSDPRREIALTHALSPSGMVRRDEKRSIGGIGFRWPEPFWTGLLLTSVSE